ncbi:hypothetical protein V6D40_02400 [Corynebacterium sp. Q4381]|uniref:hypothetical protein n=1 Tax=Corynebacterium sp. Marseille-Q4381 TaxID=3121597 RepID=UPI002FE63474
MRQVPVAVAVAAVMAIGAAPAANAQIVGVTQGKTIRVGSNSQCTLGFIDKTESEQVGYTAAHCGRSNDRVAVQVGGQWHNIGRFKPSANYVAPGTGSDWGRVEFDRPLHGYNRYTGDTAADIADLRPGDRICFHGAASGSTTCSNLIGTLGGNIYWEDTGAVAGDSGSPVWIEGRDGFLGVFTGQNIVYTPGGEYRALRASVARDVQGPTSDQEMELIAKHYGEHRPATIQVRTPVVVPAGGAQTQNVSNDGADIRRVTLITIAVLSIVVVAAPFIAQAAGF